MKKIAALLVLFASLFTEVYAQESAELPQPPNGDNQKAEVSQWIGPVKVTITYHSPRVHFQNKERTGHIWGELIPYGFFDEGFGPSKSTPWRSGANETTRIAFSHDVKVEGRDVPAGTYGLFLALDKTGPWTWILSSNANGWGSFQYRSEGRHPACAGSTAGGAFHRISHLRFRRATSGFGGGFSAMGKQARADED